MDPDTAIGGPEGRFPATRHTLLEDAAASDGARRRIAHERIAAAYWKPIYKYIRWKWREDNETAKDLTQSFFTKALDRDFFGGYDSSRAAFRTFLRLCADRFVSNERQRAGRAKRSGSNEPLDENMAAEGGDPEEYFRREWVRQIFSLSIKALRAEYEERGRLAAFQAFEFYDLAEEERPSYAELAVRLGVPVTQITNYLAAARRDLRRIILDCIRELTATEREFRSEARSVLGVDV